MADLRSLRWTLPAAVMVALVSARSRTSRAGDGPADVSFMRALHAARRRYLSHLNVVAETLDQSSDVPETVSNGWLTFRDELLRHHAAEDDDLWPLHRSHLTDSDDFAVIDEMVAEHHRIPSAVTRSTPRFSVGRTLSAWATSSRRSFANTSITKSEASFPNPRAASVAGSGERFCSPNASDGLYTRAPVFDLVPR